MYPNTIDVTNITGFQVITQMTEWTTSNGPSLVEHLAGSDPNGDLITFYWMPGQDWKAVNVSGITGQRVGGPVTSWVTPNGDRLVEHLAGQAPNGDLLTFYWMPGQDWKVVNISNITGQRISGPVTSWVTPNGSSLVEHLAGKAPNGDLLTFYWMPGQDWKAVNVSTITGQKISGPVTSWVTPNGSSLVEHLAGSSPNGDLLVFYWMPGQDWKAVNVSAVTGKKIAGPLCSWTSQNGNVLVEHVAGPSAECDLLIFYWMPGQDWKVVDVTNITGIPVQNAPHPYQITRDGFVEELLAVEGMQGSLYTLWWRPGMDWQAIDFKEAVGMDFSTPPEPWTTPDGDNIIEHIAAADANKHLIVSWYDAESRRITDNLIVDFPPLAQHRGEKRRLVVILWDPQRPGFPAPPRAAIESAFVGATNSVKQFFTESSLGRFNFDVVDFLPPAGKGLPDWYTALKPGDHYWDNPNANDPNNPAKHDPQYHQKKYNDSWLSGHAEKYAEAVWLASKDFDFSAYDFNGNGSLDPHDLRVCMVIPNNGFEGYQRVPAGQQYPTTLPLKSNGVNAGVVIPDFLEIYMANSPHIGLISHELAHILTNAGDLYHGWPPESQYVPFTPGPFSLMVQASGNLDPFHRLKYGWLRHRLALRSGHYSLRSAVPYGEALVLLDRNHSQKEYFIIENRWNAPNTCDAYLPDTGLAVWHIIEDSNIFNLTPNPVGTDPTYWASTINDWGRRGVRLIRAVVNAPKNNDSLALWDGNQPATAYDLLSDDPNPNHSRLRWVDGSADGRASGFAIRNISAAGPVMTFDLQVPW